METSKPDDAPDDVLELERIAAGPYCPFDSFKPPPDSPRTNHIVLAETPQRNKSKMMDATGIVDEFGFDGGLRAPWFTTAGEDIQLAASAPEEYGRGDWNEWMQWDPATSRPADVKPLNAQGPLCYLKPGQKVPLYNRRQNPQLRDQSLDLQSNPVVTNATQPVVSGTAFTFGGNVENPPAFHFDSGSLSSPSTADGQQQSGYYSPPGWNQSQEGNVVEHTIFSPVKLGVTTNAQPPPVSTPSLHHSPNSTTHPHTSSSSLQSSPEPAPVQNPKKRKSSMESGNTPEGKKDKAAPVKKTAHNMIEKRYRTNLNDKIAALRDSVPSLRVMSRANGGAEEDDDPEDLEGLTPAHKLNKATVLSKATEYIRHLEKRNKSLQEEVAALKGRLENYEKVAISGPMALAGAMGTTDGARYTEDPFGSNTVVGSSASGPPQGMIPVPQHIANLRHGLPEQPHYAPQPGGYPVYSNGPPRQGMHGLPLVNGGRGNSMMGKLMVGSLAGLMILEGLVEHEQSREEPDGRGLFALPFSVAHILTPQISVGGATAQLPLARLLLLFTAVSYILAPLLDFRLKPKKKATATVKLHPAPSLASPVEVRRKAWLTAIQTVWVPRHNFFLEAAALLLKILKLSTRKIIGWPGYALLTGATKEQEIARVKAWNIALDAQLTGGDAEISKSRLVLTLMASGTLPDTPACLMLKALHIRVLLWELSHAGYGTSRLFRSVSAKLARRYWNTARAEQKIAENQSPKPNEDNDKLPDHLIALLEMECDDVLIEPVVQRAYNLAWNRPSAENTTVDLAMDSVVEDFAIASPLDALASWWSSFVLNKALLGHLDSKDAVMDLLDLAVRTAPPTSQSQLRALVARSVLVEEDRAAHIAVAFEALPSPPVPSGTQAGKSAVPPLMNLVGNSSVADDIRKALTLAKCLALMESSHPHARTRAIFAINAAFLPPVTMTLLSCVAAYQTINHVLKDISLEKETTSGLERLVSSVRMWVGQEAGRRSGLSNKVRTKIIKRCIDINKKLVGLIEEESDAGYVSQSDTNR